MKNSACRFILAMLPVILATAGTARAESDEEVARTARKACLSGNYIKGIELLSDLFVRTKEPTHIYNQARCYEQNGRFEEAILRFREFLVLKGKNVNPEERAQAEEHMATCQALLEAKQPKGIVVPPVTPADTTPLATKPEPIAPVQDSGRGKRIAGMACGAAGLLSVGTGVYFYSRAVSYSDKVSNQDVTNPSDESAGKRAETLQWVFYGAGGALLATGVVLYVLGLQDDGDKSRVAGMSPWIGRDSLGLVAHGAF